MRKNTPQLAAWVFYCEIPGHYQIEKPRITQQRTYQLQLKWS